MKKWQFSLDFSKNLCYNHYKDQWNSVGKLWIGYNISFRAPKGPRNDRRTETVKQNAAPRKALTALFF